MEPPTEAFKKPGCGNSWVLDTNTPFFKEIIDTYSKSFGRDIQKAEARDLVAIRLGNGRTGES